MKFEKFIATPSGQRATSLLRSHKVTPEKMFMEVESAVNEALPGLIYGALYTTEQLCGPELWAAYRTAGPRRAAGNCMAFLVDIGAVPLRQHITKSGKGLKRYVLSTPWKPGAMVVD
jgi:hypothetical protein